MSTVIYPSPIFGPVHSRRLGVSLGINLLPEDGKFCTFDCIYCECGWNAEHPGARRFNSREDVRTMLGATLRQMVSEGTPPDVITFAGNGEPTMHPDFEAIIDDTIVEGGTLRQRIRINCNKLIRTPDTSAENHKPTGMK